MRDFVEVAPAPPTATERRRSAARAKRSGPSTVAATAAEARWSLWGDAEG